MEQPTSTASDLSYLMPATLSTVVIGAFEPPNFVNSDKKIPTSPTSKIPINPSIVFRIPDIYILFHALQKMALSTSWAEPMEKNDYFTFARPALSVATSDILLRRSAIAIACSYASFARVVSPAS